MAEKLIKPPLGVDPMWLWQEGIGKRMPTECEVMERLYNVSAAIARYRAAGVGFPDVWNNEKTYLMWLIMGLENGR